MTNLAFLKQICRFSIGLVLLLTGQFVHAAVSDSYSKDVKACLQKGWKHLSVKVAGQERAILWKRPRIHWKQGAMVLLHGTGGSHHQFCTGGDALEAQIEFAEEAVEQGFAVFLLDSTNHAVTDNQNRSCGKQFDFSVQQRRNIDLPFIGKVINNVIPQLRPGRSSKNIFLTGLSTGGYMATRAAVHFNHKVTAFAPIAAGDPFGTKVRCDRKLIQRKKLKGILIDLDTNKSVSAKRSCKARAYLKEKAWPVTRAKLKPSFKQFHHQGDSIVDISCMTKAKKLLLQHGYSNDGSYIMKAKKRRTVNHQWFEDYNEEIINFFSSKNKKNK